MANLKKVIYINEEDYSTLINGDSLVIDGTTYTYEENALYVIKNAGPPEYAETAGYATNAGTSQVAVSDASGNNIAATYEKKPLIIEVNESDSGTTLEQGTYDSITQALALNRLVILKLARDNDDNEILYLPLLIDYTVTDNIYLFIVWYGTYTSYKAEINSHDEFYYVMNTLAEDDVVVHKADTETITGNKTFTGTVSLGSKATATTPAATDNDTSVATTAFVHNIIDAIPEITTGQIVGRMHRDNVSGTGNLTITGASGEGFSPNGITTAGKYIVVVYSWSDTKTFGYNISFGSNNYTLSTTDGTISDKRELTVSAGALWSGSVTTAVSAGTTIIVEIYKAEKTTPALSVGTVALTNLYNDLDGKPTISSSTSSSSTTDIASSKAVKLAYDHGGVQSVNGQTGAVTLTLGDTNVIESISVNGVAQTITNKNVDITLSTEVDSELDPESTNPVENQAIFNELKILGVNNNGHEYVDLGLPSGTLWATMSVGATAIEELGDTFKWGEVTFSGGGQASYKYFDGTNYTKYNSSDNKTQLDPEDDAATVNWGGNWCTPTLVQLQELINNCTQSKTTINGVNGRLFTRNDKSIFFPCVNFLQEFWTSTLYSEGYANMAYFYAGDNPWQTRMLVYDSYQVRPVIKPGYIDKYLPNDTLIPTNLHIILTKTNNVYNSNYTFKEIETALNSGGYIDLYYNSYLYSYDGEVDDTIYFYRVSSKNVGNSTNSDNVYEHCLYVDKNNNWHIESTSLIKNATTSRTGVVQLNDTVTSTSTSLAATANAVKQAYDNGGVQSVNSQTGAVVLNIPTKTSDLTNDSNFTTLSEVTLTIVNSAPETLDTLNELAAALGDDPNFATTVATQIGQKYTKPSTGIPASDLAVGVIPDVPVQSVNGMTGAVTVDVPVTSVNGATGAVITQLSDDYAPSSEVNENLELAAGDTYEEAFSKLEKTINDNETITAAALTDLDSRINTLHLPQSLDDIPDGSTRKLSDYATTTLLATKQDALVSGTNIKTINNESILGSGNITIQGGSGGDTNVIETVKVNGTALTPDANKAVDISIDTIVIDLYDEFSEIAMVADATGTLPSGLGLSILEKVHQNKYVVILGADDSGNNVLYRFAKENQNSTLDFVCDTLAITWILRIDPADNSWVYKKRNKGTINGVQVNGTDLTPDSTTNKVDITVPTTLDSISDGTTRKLSDYLPLSGGTMTGAITVAPGDGKGLLFSTTSNINVSGTTNTILGFYNGTYIIGHTAYPVNIRGTNTRPNYNGNQLALYSDIPSEITESTVSGWGFTKNTGTVTGVKMNGITNNPTNGVVDLGTVLTSFTETDPTVPAWAKAANKPTYTAAEVGALSDTTVIPAAPGTLNTTATTAQSTSSSEALSGNITLHKVAKTGTYNDLIGKPTIPAAQVQSDWNATSGMGAILNKPTIPTVNNATLTIQKNGTTVNTFTANASSNVTANIQVNELPTVSSSDNGKILQVVNGAWALVTPVTVYTGTSTPNSSLGSNGDLYVLTS